MPLSTPVALLISAGVSAAGAIAQGQQAKAQAKFQAAVNEQQAARTRQISAGQEEDFRRRQSRLFAERRAALGAAGVEAGTGTPLLTFGDFAAETELQALRIRSGGQTQATRLEQQASLTRAGGRAARRRGFFRAGSSLLSGFAEANEFSRTTP